MTSRQVDEAPEPPSSSRPAPRRARPPHLGSPARPGDSGLRRAERDEPLRAELDREEAEREVPDREVLDREVLDRYEPERGAADRRELPDPLPPEDRLVDRLVDRRVEPPDRRDERRGAEEAMGGIVPDQMNREENEERGPEGPRSV